MAARCGSASECLKLGSEPAFLSLSPFFFFFLFCFFLLYSDTKNIEKDEIVVLLLNNCRHLFFFICVEGGGRCLGASLQFVLLKNRKIET